MKNQRQDYDKAEEYYQRAIEADPKRANTLGNYATFLKSPTTELRQGGGILPARD